MRGVSPGGRGEGSEGGEGGKGRSEDVADVADAHHLSSEDTVDDDGRERDEVQLEGGSVCV